MGPFARFVFECFEKVGAPTGSVMRLINQFGSVRRQMERAHPTELSAISG